MYALSYTDIQHSLKFYKTHSIIRSIKQMQYIIRHTGVFNSLSKNGIQFSIVLYSSLYIFLINFLLTSRINILISFFL